jgi:Pentapeptide repeats (8 copies)
MTRVKAKVAKSKSSTWQTIFQGVSAVAVPVSIVVLIVGVYDFKSQQQTTAEQALNQQRQATLDDYLNDVSALVLNYRLSGPKPKPAVRALAVARTETALRNLDGARKGILIRYLWEAELIRGRSPVLYLHQANLNGADFKSAYLFGADLSTDYLFRANFSDADAYGANLSWADLVKAGLDKANLGCVNTSRFAVTVEMLQQAHPKSLDCADLKHANLSDARLADADLVGTNLTHAILAGADLHGARYNSYPICIKRTGKKTLTILPTQWPQGYNPAAEKAHRIGPTSAAASKAGCPAGPGR